jgi:uncharacterized protein YbjT (DUF2867 family)
MSIVAIVGGNGQIARLLHPLLVSRGHTPLALVRSESHRNRLEAMGAAVRLLDLEHSTAHGVASVLEDADTVIFSAGGGPDGDIERKRTVDLEGSLKSIEAARDTGIRRFVQVSAINVDEPVPDSASPVWRAYVEAKRDADAALRDSGLDWTIIRPGLLTDGPGTGLVELGQDVARAEVSRADVAAVLAEVVDSGAGIGAQWNLVSGDTLIAEAVAGA